MAAGEGVGAGAGDTLTEAMSGAGPELARTLAAVVAATGIARRHLGIAVDDQSAAAEFVPAAHRTP